MEIKVTTVFGAAISALKIISEHLPTSELSALIIIRTSQVPVFVTTLNVSASENKWQNHIKARTYTVYFHRQQFPGIGIQRRDKLHLKTKKNEITISLILCVVV